MEQGWYGSPGVGGAAGPMSPGPEGKALAEEKDAEGMGSGGGRYTPSSATFSPYSPGHAQRLYVRFDLLPSRFSQKHRLMGIVCIVQDPDDPSTYPTAIDSEPYSPPAGQQNQRVSGYHGVPEV